MIVRQDPAPHGAQLLIGEPDDCSFASNAATDNPASFIVDDDRVLAVAFPAHLLLEPASTGVGLGRDRQDRAIFSGFMR